jgi:hypothetical protein
MKGKSLLVSMVLIGVGLVLLAGCQTAKEPAPAPDRVAALSDMSIISVEIEAPPEAVFSYMTDLENFYEWEWTENSNYQGPEMGKTWDCSFEFQGQKLSGSVVVVEYIPGKKWGIAFNGDFHGTDTWLFVPAGAGTKLTFIQFAAAVGPDMTWEAWNSIIQENKKNIEKGLQKIKELVERQ